LERRRQEALFAADSATRQKVEQVVADEERFRAQPVRSKNSICLNSIKMRDCQLVRRRWRELDVTRRHIALKIALNVVLTPFRSVCRQPAFSIGSIFFDHTTLRGRHVQPATMIGFKQIEFFDHTTSIGLVLLPRSLRGYPDRSGRHAASSPTGWAPRDCVTTQVK
jgi:hypothetical protein